MDPGAEWFARISSANFCHEFLNIFFVVDSHYSAAVLLLSQRIPCPMDEEDRKPVFRELAVCKQAADCPYTVSYYGAFFGEVRFKKSMT